MGAFGWSRCGDASIIADPGYASHRSIAPSSFLLRLSLSGLGRRNLEPLRHDELSAGDALVTVIGKADIRGTTIRRGAARRSTRHLDVICGA